LRRAQATRDTPNKSRGIGLETTILMLREGASVLMADISFKTPDHFDILCDMIEGTREEMEQLAGIVLSS
jgi:hypothetical protein